MPYVLLATGSRDLASPADVDRVLNAELAEHPDMWIRVGDCPSGADLFVRTWARRTWGDRWTDRCGVYEAHWLRLGHRAGPERNGRMVRDGASKAVAFFQPGTENKGTSGCVALAEAAGIEVVRYGWAPPPADLIEHEALPI